MLITNELIKKLAQLSKLRLTKEQEEKFPKQLDDIFQMFEKLKELNTDNVEVSNFNEVNRTRDDVVIEYLDKDKLLNQAVEKKKGFIKVKSVLGKAT